MLSALATEPNVQIACLYDNQGRIFAEYRSSGDLGTLVSPSMRNDGAYFAGDSLTLFRGVLLNGEHTGSIALVFDLRGFRSVLLQYAKIALLDSSCLRLDDLYDLAGQVPYTQSYRAKFNSQQNRYIKPVKSLLNQCRWISGLSYIIIIGI